MYNIFEKLLDALTSSLISIFKATIFGALALPVGCFWVSIFMLGIKKISMQMFIDNIPLYLNNLIELDVILSGLVFMYYLLNIGAKKGRLNRSSLKNTGYGIGKA